MNSPHLGFIVGMGRSGTTLIAAMLNRHPHICVLPETGFFVHVKSLPHGFQDLAENWPDSMVALADKMRRNATPAWNPEETARFLIEKYPEFPGIRTLFQTFCTTIAQTFGKPEARLILEKTPDHMLCIEEIRTSFPDASILHIIRDGRAVAESRSRMTFLPPDRRDLEFNMLNWAWRMRTVRPLLSRKNQTMEFRYEELVSYPQETLQAILAFLHLDYHPGLLRPQGNEDHLIETGMAHKDSVKRPIDPHLAEAWRNRISPRQQKFLEHLAGKQLDELGYRLHHVQLDQMRTALIPQGLSTHPNLLKEHRENLMRLLTKNEAVVVGTYQSLDTAPCTHDIYALDLIEPAKARKTGSLHYFLNLLKRVLRLKLHGRHILFLKPKRQYAFKEWPLACLTESLIRALFHAR